MGNISGNRYGYTTLFALFAIFALLSIVNINND